MRLLPLLLLGLAAPAALAQTGRGEVSGVVLPRCATALGGLGQWPSNLPDTARVATLSLTPIRTLVCSARSGPDCAPRTVYARGLHGRYASGRLPLGEYRMRVSAPGCTPVTRTLVIVSDSRSVEHVALTCRAEG